MNSNTPLSRDQTKKVLSIVQSLIDNGESQEFRLPVDYKSLIRKKIKIYKLFKI